MIFAAGLGTRFKPWTDSHPKALALVNGKSLLQRNVEYLQQHGIYDVVVNVHHFSEQIIEAVEKNKGWGSSVQISDESDQVLETGGGLKKASPLLSADLIVIINADILTDLDLNAMIHHHQSSNAISTLAVTNRKTSRYFLFDNEGVLSGWKNTQTEEEIISRPTTQYHEKAFSGIHVISRALLNYLNKDGKFGIVDVYLELSKTQIIQSFDHSGNKFIDVGKPDAVAKAEALFV
jgi:N-acetyl-alpha-D-muramate 1-phosphate uridylyltransferase